MPFYSDKCPCCGGNSHINTMPVFYPLTSENSILYYVECEDCGLRTRGTESFNFAISLWNRRDYKNAVQ